MFILRFICALASFLLASCASIKSNVINYGNNSHIECLNSSENLFSVGSIVMYNSNTSLLREIGNIFGACSPHQLNFFVNKRSLGYKFYSINLLSPHTIYQRRLRIDLTGDALFLHGNDNNELLSILNRAPTMLEYNKEAEMPMLQLKGTLVTLFSELNSHLESDRTILLCLGIEYMDQPTLSVLSHTTKEFEKMDSFLQRRFSKTSIFQRRISTDNFERNIYKPTKIITKAIFGVLKMHHINSKRDSFIISDIQEISILNEERNN